MSSFKTTKKWPLSDRDKLEAILQETRLTRTELAKALEVDYKSIYRWLNSGVKPHPRQSRDIDAFFKDHVDARPLLRELQKNFPDPIKRLRTNAALRDKFFLEMTYHSNAIEGSRMTRRETEMTFQGKPVKGKEMFEMMEVINHKNALEYALEKIKPGFRITEEYVLKLHEIVMYNFNNKLPGRYRTGYVNLTNSEKALPSAQMVPVKMKEWVGQINRAGRDPIGKCAQDHYEFEAIHPFFDGNGRVGRLVLATQLLARGLPPALIQIEDQHKYYRGLSKGDMGDFKNLVQMICEAIYKGFALFLSE